MDSKNDKLKESLTWVDFKEMVVEIDDHIERLQYLRDEIDEHAEALAKRGDDDRETKLPMCRKWKC